MDPLDDVFSAMRVNSALYARMEATAPWGVKFGRRSSAKFGLVVRGGGWLTVEGKAKPISLTAGDCYVLMQGTPYTVQDSVRSPIRACTEIVKGQEGACFAFGGRGAPTTIIAGWFEFDALAAKPLTEIIPSVLHVRLESQRAQHVQTVMQLFASETDEAGLGTHLVISRLADILFVQAIRAHAASRGEADVGWLAALGDKRVGPSLRAMHQNIGHAWTVESLAATAGMSRSSFASRFKERVGESPLEYLTRWRMFRAGCLLRQSEASLAEVAGTVGYESEAAFSKAFKRITGSTPGNHRHAHSN